MRKFVSAGAAFYMLDKGERLTKCELFHRYDPVRFVIWPRGDKWDLLERVGNEWLRLTDRLFDSENEAFVFAYDKFCTEQGGARIK
ncbi:hypothetical protein [Pantoea vagans]|uniref:hypothetical protein n=1 Tax=Pantoea vagans TaxID=470934 RepID=UPI0006613D70|nr:hypothetical protein [Pantoea vagans]DAL13966.1 MAG TPA_asm: hypothetical protein [Caudoviricetes sp.]